MSFNEYLPKEGTWFKHQQLKAGRETFSFVDLIVSFTALAYFSILYVMTAVAGV